MGIFFLKWIVDIDLDKILDNLPQDKLINFLCETYQEKRTEEREKKVFGDK